MKSFKKLMLAGLFGCALTVSAFPCSAKTLSAPVLETESQITSRADKLEWRFKKINGKTYRRLYNITQDVWIGDWELVG